MFKCFDKIFVCCSGHVIEVEGLWSLSSWIGHPSPGYLKGYAKRTTKQLQRPQQQKILTSDRQNAPTTKGAVRTTEWSSGIIGVRSRNATTPTKWRWTVYLVPRTRTVQTAQKNPTVDDRDPSKSRLLSLIIRKRLLSLDPLNLLLLYLTFVFFLL